MLRWGLGLVAVIIPVQMFFGHLTGEYVLHYQPAKFAAIEARWHTQQPASEVLIAIPDECRATKPVRDRGAEARQLYRFGHLGFARGRAGYVPARGPPASVHPVLDLSPDGRHGPHHAGGLLVRHLAALARPPGDHALVPVGRVCVFPHRLRRRAHGLVHRRDRPPALGGLRPVAHQGCGDAVAGDRRCVFSLLAYIVVYAVIYSFGLYYIYRLLRDGPAVEVSAALPGAARAGAIGGGGQ